MPGYTVIQASAGMPNASQRRLRSKSSEIGREHIAVHARFQEMSSKAFRQSIPESVHDDGRAGRAGNKLEDHFRGLKRGPDRRQGRFIIFKMHDVWAAVSFDDGAGNVANTLAGSPAMNQIGNSGANTRRNNFLRIPGFF